ncbi:MAS20-domain-containing protein [Phanerochaete sordida]|uniref:MAS20-domain-containing protein n=1 Tax=Phanerochaete sordida TaxID=48140 RepID=A0A9P3FYS1_9APHY|nr:MAS20-domain-containing protein [Phanerochaete sordida]
MSSSASRTSTFLTIAGVTVLSGFLAYAVYFDYKRRNDADFRKKLRKDKKRVEKAATASSSTVDFTSGSRADVLKAEMAKIRAEPLPEGTREKEQYFMEQATLGEQLCTQGPAFAVSAAFAFFRALRVYPSPVELIMLYQSSLPPEVFAVILELTNLDVKERAEGYYDHFPPKSWNVRVQDKDGKKVLVADKDFEKGDVIYKEYPIVAALDWDLLEAGSHCAYCLKLVHKVSEYRPESDLLNTVYCSRDCYDKAKQQYHGILFTLDPLLPPDLDAEGVAADPEKRKAAQEALVAHLKSNKKLADFLVAKWVALQITIETSKVIPGSVSPAKDLPKYLDDDAPEYAIGDHLERLRFLGAEVKEEDTEILRNVFGTALPGLENSLTEDRHATTLGKMLYNAIGICYSGGRDDRPQFHERPEDQERTRTPYGTSHQVGSGLFLVSSYIQHSCEPSVRPSFTAGNHKLSLIATRAIAAGEELTMAYVDVAQHEGESAADARRRRRFELARGWRFKCECARCAAEDEGAGEADLGVTVDESKVEDAAARFEAKKAEAEAAETD